MRTRIAIVPAIATSRKFAVSAAVRSCGRTRHDRRGGAGRGDPGGHPALEPGDRLLGRVRATRAVRKLLGGGDPLPAVLLAVLHQGDVVREVEIAIDRARLALHHSLLMLTSSNITPRCNKE